MRAAHALLLIALWMLSAPSALAARVTPVAPGERKLFIEDVDGETWCTVQGVGVPIAGLIEDIAERMDLAVLGLAEIPPDVRADLYLENRRVSEVLTYILGLVDLRAERRANRLTLVKQGSTLASPDYAALLELASLAYLRVTRKFPEHPEVPWILLSQARISRDLDREGAARSQYEELVNRFLFSEPTRLALYELGQLLMQIGEYGTAAQEFAELLRFERGTETERSARLQLAHCRAEVGQYEDALLILQALDSKNPPRTREDRQERLYSRARFLIGLGQPEEALESLDRADSFGITDGRVRRLALRLRAMALESNRRPSEASRAWLAYQAEVEGPDRAHALAKAAQTALESGRGEDLLAVVFIAEMAAEEGAPEATAEYLAEARQRLKLGEPKNTNSPQRGLAIASELVAKKLYGEALQHLAPLAKKRDSLTNQEALRMIDLQAQSLANTQSIETAAEFLRSELPLWSDASDRKQLYVLAADLFAAHGRWQAEIEALQGRL